MRWESFLRLSVAVALLTPQIALPQATEDGSGGRPGLIRMLLGPGSSEAESAGPVVDGDQSEEGELGVRIPDYRLVVGDVIDVEVHGEPELDAKITLDGNGEAAPELLSRIALEGLTLEEAEMVIRDAYMVDYLVDPIVSVEVVEYGKSTFAILGEVNEPGYYFFSSNKKMDLLEAVAMAGGYTRLGSPNRIVVKRTVKEEEKIFKLNAKAMSSGSREPFEILSGDIITVRQSIF